MPAAVCIELLIQMRRTLTYLRELRKLHGFR